MPTIFSPAALADLLAIDDYIASDNPQRAASFVDELEAAAREIDALLVGDADPH